MYHGTRTSGVICLNERVLPFEFETQPHPVRHPIRNTLLVVSGLLVAVVVVAGIYAFGLANTFDSAKKITQSFPEEATRPALSPNASQNILLMGSDTRGEISEDIEDIEGTRSDTMMVVHVPEDRQSLQIMSIMRDSWVDIPGYGEAKINAALAYGGVPLVVQTVEGLIDARIDRVAVVDFEGFAGITDALGGVAVENPIDFTSSHKAGHTYAAGTIVLDGAEALAFVRERYAFADGDFQRVRNQQIFVKGLLREVLSAETLTNPVKVNDLVASVAPYLTVDSGFTSAYAAGLGLELRSIRMSDLTFFTAPTLGTGMEGTQSVVNLNWDEMAVVKEHFRNDSLAEYQVRK